MLIAKIREKFLPSPSYFYKDYCGALPMKEFGARKGDYTWED